MLVLALHADDGNDEFGLTLSGARVNGGFLRGAGTVIGVAAGDRKVRAVVGAAMSA